VRFVVCGFHERVLDGWDGMAFDTPILINFNNSCPSTIPKLHLLSGRVFHVVLIPASNQGLISSLACDDIRDTKHALQT
jgi:hypothetical protein